MQTIEQNVIDFGEFRLEKGNTGNFTHNYNQENLKHTDN